MDAAHGLSLLEQRRECQSLNLYFRSGTFSVTLKQRSSITWMKEVATRVKIQHKRSNDRWYFSGVHISLF